MSGLLMTLAHREFTVKPSEVVAALGKFGCAAEVVSVHRARLNIKLG